MLATTTQCLCYHGTYEKCLDAVLDAGHFLIFLFAILSVEVKVIGAVATDSLFCGICVHSVDKQNFTHQFRFPFKL